MSNKMSRPAFERGLHRRLGRAVAIVEHRRPFDELAGVDQAVELGVVDEMIVDVVALARAASGRVVALIDMVIFGSASSSMRLIVDLPAPDGEERTISRPRRRRSGRSVSGRSMAAIALAAPSASSAHDLCCNCTKILEIVCGALIVHCSIKEIRRG